MYGIGAFGQFSKGWTRGLCHAVDRLGTVRQKLEGSWLVASCSLSSVFPYGRSYDIDSRARGDFRTRYLARKSQFSHVLAAGLSYLFGHTTEHIDLE